MEKEILALRFAVNKKQVRQMLALLFGEALTDEELNKRFYDREPITFDIAELDDDASKMLAFLVACMIAKEKENI